MTTRITCVYDEGSQPYTSLIGAKGTALLVEKDGKRVLFNTGLRDRYLIHNMEHLGLDFYSIDAVVV
ncbi:MAG: MBL fold metallo-hydrolase, partial [Candidatus Methanomethylophilaceae archaeon]|nr:MBL fold metallo-hydrolase [Candidatus Methanomethylophilaceae archaeon]